MWHNNAYIRKNVKENAMLKFLSNLFDEGKRKLDFYQKLVLEINSLEEDFATLSDEELKGKTSEFKARIKNYLKDFDPKDKEAYANVEKDILNKLLPEAFATVRETSKRVIGLRHFDVQLMAGIALHYGTITEQKTGEGKTLTVTCPLYLNALLGKGVHLVTVNDYLAEIGVGWMGPIYEFLGLKTSVIVHDQAKLYDSSVDSEERGDERLEHFVEIDRKDAYQADITYGTNNEFGFDYLRDNMVQSLGQMVQRTSYAHHFAIVDEADSILIDEARTPLIISAPDTTASNKYYDFARMVKSLTADQDYKIDEKAKTATLTDLGVKRLEQKLGVSNLYEESFDTIHMVETALKAMTLYKRDTEYIVRDNKVIIVDEHTGRLMYGRRFSDGLHQAIEAKEAVPIQKESRTLATISIQNYFRMYSKLAGMTGTAATEAEEFKKIYNVDVLTIPTNQEVIRQDKADVVYKTTAAKYSAIVKEIERINATGQPILIGTRSIDHNQIISKFLLRKKINHQVLNAKNHEKEAFIIADAGKKNSITVATNIAGRGVDIVLGGAKPELKDYRKKERVKEQGKLDEAYQDLNIPVSINPANYNLNAYKRDLEKWQQAHEEVVSLGGLYIIGTQRHESRRIDNQLRGRSGRQGDPGTSQFFVALDDEIMRIFGGEQISKVMDFLKIEESQAIEHKMISKAIESAQVRVEGFFFDQRKRLVEFDDVMNKHREIIYKRRRRLLEQAEAAVKIDQSSSEELDLEIDEEKDSLTKQIKEFVHEEIQNIIKMRDSDNLDKDELDAVIKEFVTIIPFDDKSQFALKSKFASLEEISDLEEELIKIADKTYEAREKALGEDQMRFFERMVTLSTLDEKWMDHLDEMDNLKDGIWLRGDKQTVLSEYQKEAFLMFEELITLINSTIAKRIFRIQATSQPIRTVVPTNIILEKEDVNESISKEVADATPPTRTSVPSKMKGNVSSFASALGGVKTKATVKSQAGVKKEKIGRNDPCPCGSGKKYKKCCLLKEQ